MISTAKFNQELIPAGGAIQKGEEKAPRSGHIAGYQVTNEMEVQGFQEDPRSRGQFEIESADETDVSGQRTELNSLAVLLEQSLQNNDTKIIDYCLDTTDVKVINNSVRQLPVKKIFVLLDRLIERIHTYPYKLGVQLKWLNAILSHQAGHLLLDPKINAKIGPLLALLEKRTSVHDSLKGFQAKLSLLLAIKKQQRNRAGQGVEIDRRNARPLVTVEEKPMKVVVEEEKPLVRMVAEEKQPEFDDSISVTEEEAEEDFDEEEDADNEFDEMLAAKVIQTYDSEVV